VDVQAQESFMEVLSGLLERTVESKAVIYYGDGVHPTHNTRSTHAWIEKGTDRERPTLSSRDRVNINAVLNAKDPVDVIALDCESVNAAGTRMLYEKVLEKNPDADIIYMITDKARFPSTLFPESKPDRTPVEVPEKEGDQYRLVPH